jgi:hypothetical protein
MDAGSIKDHAYVPSDTNAIGEDDESSPCGFRGCGRHRLEHHVEWGGNLVQGERPDSVLGEAADIVSADRLKQYGPPSESFGRIAQMWSAYLGVEVTAHDVAQLMILLKVSRSRAGIVSSGAPQRDSLVDIAGYVACAELLG